MKKNISINLQGIIFHIEEDGYEQLSSYLASIRNYFSSYEGHEEIIADIELRIAEIFTVRLSPGKQVITQEDVKDLVAQMGNVTDFEMDPAEEEEAPFAASSARTGAGESYDFGAGAPAAEFGSIYGTKKLYRDVMRKVISGVAAGVANYMNVDPLWIRLLFVFLVIGIPFTNKLLWFGNSPFSVGFGGIGVILYIVLWIVLPVNYNLPETKVKKFYRDPMEKKLGGVASGIAKYFGVDVTAIRILFLVSIFLGGTGLLLYIILWIAVPQAVSLTERMQMQGNPVTLSGIEQTLKENLNMKDSNGQESTFAKILLLPFRLLSQFFNWLGTALGPILGFLIALIRVGAGVVLLITSVALTIALFVTLLVSMGLVDAPESFMFGNYPASIILEGFPRLGLVTGFLVGLIPIIFLWILSIALISKQFFLRQIVGWSLFAVWLVSLFTFIAIIVFYTQNFSRSGEVETTKSFHVEPYPTVTLDAYQMNSFFSDFHVDLKSHGGDKIEVIQRVQARGRNEADARENARMVSYRVVQNDSVLRFDNGFEFKEGAALRKQRLNLVLLLPQNKPLHLTESFYYMLPNAIFDVEYSREKVLRNTWQAKGSYLTCLTCEADTLDQETDAAYVLGSSTENLGKAGSVLLAMTEYSSNVKAFEERDFNKLEINGLYHVQILQGREYDVRIHADNDELQKIRIERAGDELLIESRQRYAGFFNNSKPVLIQITVPTLRALKLSGAIKADVGRLETDDLELSLSGAVRSALNLQAGTIRANMSGAAHTTFTGRANFFDIDASGANKIDAGNLISEDVSIDASGACNAQVHASKSLRVDASGGSSIAYSGNPDNVITDVSGAGKVMRR